MNNVDDNTPIKHTFYAPDALEFIPGASTIKAIIDCILRGVTKNPAKENASSPKQHPYITHIHQQSPVVHAAAFVPVLGNIALIVYRWREHCLTSFQSTSLPKSKDPSPNTSTLDHPLQTTETTLSAIEPPSRDRPIDFSKTDAEWRKHVSDMYKLLLKKPSPVCGKFRDKGAPYTIHSTGKGNLTFSCCYANCVCTMDDANEIASITVSPYSEEPLEKRLTDEQWIELIRISYHNAFGPVDKNKLENPGDYDE